MRKFMFLAAAAVLAFAGTSCKTAGGDTSGLLALLFGSKSSAKAITAFAVDGTAGLISGTTITVSLPCSHSSDLTSLPAVFVSTGALVMNGSTRVTSGDMIDFSDQVTLSVIAEDGSTQAYTVNVGLASSTAKSISSFSINGVPGVINEGDHTITVDLPCTVANVTALVAAFTFSGDTVTVDTATQTSGVTPNDFTGTVAYRVTACDASWQEYAVTVTIADDTLRDMSAFSINGRSGFISGNNIHVVLPDGTSRSGLVAVFAAAGASVTVGAAVQTSGATANNFNAPVTYRVHACNGVDYRDYIVQVSTFTVKSVMYDDNPDPDTVMERSIDIFASGADYRQSTYIFAQGGHMVPFLDASVLSTARGQVLTKRSTGAGGDTNWFTGDDTGQSMMFKQYVDATHARFVYYSDYIGTVSYYAMLALDASGRILNLTYYNGAGTDAEWFTVDDVVGHPTATSIFEVTWADADTASAYGYAADGTTVDSYFEADRNTTTGIDLLSQWSDGTKATLEGTIMWDYAHLGLIQSGSGFVMCIKATLNSNGKNVDMMYYDDDGGDGDWWDGDETFAGLHNVYQYDGDGNLYVADTYSDQGDEQLEMHTLYTFE